MFKRISTLFYLFLLFFSFESRADFFKSKGFASANLIKQKIDIDSSKQLTYEIPISNFENTNNKQNNSILKAENNIVYKIRAESNSVLNIIIGNQEKVYAKTQEEPIEINLKNEYGEFIKAKISVKNTKVIFDKNGQSRLQINIDIPSESANIRGSYKATYFVVIQY